MLYYVSVVDIQSIRDTIVFTLIYHRSGFYHYVCPLACLLLILLLMLIFEFLVRRQLTIFPCLILVSSHLSPTIYIPHSTPEILTTATYIISI